MDASAVRRNHALVLNWACPRAAMTATIVAAAQQLVSVTVIS